MGAIEAYVIENGVVLGSTGFTITYEEIKEAEAEGLIYRCDEDACIGEPGVECYHVMPDREFRGIVG